VDEEPAKVECRDEDGHDGEDCTCAADIERCYPQPGTYAFTAWMMAKSGMMTGDEADRWKDDMKEGGY
jgi:hypothetical protein